VPKIFKPTLFQSKILQPKIFLNQKGLNPILIIIQKYVNTVLFSCINFSIS